jgi:hypothetical protein
MGRKKKEMILWETYEAVLTFRFFEVVKVFQQHFLPRRIASALPEVEEKKRDLL